MHISIMQGKLMKVSVRNSYIFNFVNNYGNFMPPPPSTASANPQTILLVIKFGTRFTYNVPRQKARWSRIYSLTY